MTLRLGVLGFSPGNGHPYSFSAIVNGYDDEAFARWYDGMLARYRLAGRQRLQVPLKHTYTDRADFMRLCYDVYDFVPRDGGDPPARVGLVEHVEEPMVPPLD